MNVATIVEACILALMVFLPGWAVVAWATPRIGVLARCGAALALSPALTGGVIALLAYCGIGIARSGILVLGVSGAICIASVLRASRHRRNILQENQPDSGEPKRVTIIIALLAAVLIGSFSLTQEWWRVFSDAWFHGPYVESILRSGIPPVDPHFADFELNYHWIYHTFVASIAAISKMDPFMVMAWLQIFAIISVVFSIGHLAYRIHGRRVGWTLSFVLLGLNALFPIFLLAFTTVRATSGEVRGIQELGRIFPYSSLGWLEGAAFLRLLGGQGLFLDKFLVTTPLALSLAAVCAWAGTFWRWFDGSMPMNKQITGRKRTGEKGELLLAALLTMSAGLLHAVVGPALVAATIGVLLLAVLERSRHPRSLRAAGKWTLAVIIGFFSIAWHLSTLIGTGGAHRQLPLDLSPMKIVGLISCLAAGFIFGLRPARKLFSAGGAGRMWIEWLLAVLGLALVVRLPGPSVFVTVDKFSYLVWIPLAVTAGAAFGDTLMRVSIGKRIMLLVLLLLPVNGFALVSRIMDQHAGQKQPWNLPAHVWMRRRLPRDAVLLTPLGDMNAAVFAGRDQYYSDHAQGQLCGYPDDELTARHRLVEQLYSQGIIDSVGIARLEDLGRPVYAVWFDSSSPVWKSVPGSLPHVETGHGQKPPWDNLFPTVFESDHYTISAVTERAKKMLEPGEGVTGQAGEGEDRFRR